jgi:hypothetical protein
MSRYFPFAGFPFRGIVLYCFGGFAELVSVISKRNTSSVAGNQPRAWCRRGPKYDIAAIISTSQTPRGF